MVIDASKYYIDGRQRSSRPISRRPSAPTGKFSNQFLAHLTLTFGLNN
jgi:hypothetical protein